MNDQIHEPWNLRVLDHAIAQYRARTSGGKATSGSIANKLRNIVMNGMEMVLRSPDLEVKQMMDHGFRKARYFKEGYFMVVVEDRNIITMHLGEAGKWKEKEKSHSGA